MDNKIIEKIQKYKKEVYSPYNNKLYVPMPESRDLFLPVTVGCSYNKCLYCGLNKNIQFKKLPLELIEENLKKLQYINEYSKRKIEKVVLLGGNPFVLKTEYLLEISKLIVKYFKEVKYISSFTRADDILRKTEEELKILKENRYDNLSVGVESGSNTILKLQEKGVTAEENLEAMKMLEKAKINYSAYIMLGFGGKKYSNEKAEETSKLLNLVKPFEIIVVNLVYFPNAPLLELVKNKEFKRLTPLESLKEEYLLLSKLKMENTMFNATHKNNVIAIKGRLPEHKDILLEKIKRKIADYEN
ncbi:radical SAM protein [Miniphocaeibacter massiliensis]|uniref:radical SAM protein n=1 Tax=Miniphocaeibacter massiliensis TaxID=2041841 RepID=UPI000C1BABC9|nr:radical SAM protein [Miniphocaeibacter massiliensis]